MAQTAESANHAISANEKSPEIVTLSVSSSAMMLDSMTSSPSTAFFKVAGTSPTMKLPSVPMGAVPVGVLNILNWASTVASKFTALGFSCRALIVRTALGKLAVYISGPRVSVTVIVTDP